MSETGGVTYSVQWKELWWSLTKYMILAIAFPAMIVFVVKLVSNGFSYQEVLEYDSLAIFVGLILGIFILIAGISFLVSVSFKLASITITEDYICGRNYWGRKKRIPLSYISSLEPVSNSGMSAIVIKGGAYGEIYVYSQTDKFDELIDRLEAISLR